MLSRGTELRAVRARTWGGWTVDHSHLTSLVLGQDLVTFQSPEVMDWMLLLLLLQHRQGVQDWGRGLDPSLPSQLRGPQT